MVIKYISGPTQIVRMKSDTYDKDIYLLGDNHSDLSDSCAKNINTMKIHNFLNDFFLKSDKCITYDFFLEVGFFDKNINLAYKNSYLYKIINYFSKKKCFSINKINQEECSKKYKNIRFHISDVRKNDLGFKLEYSPMIFGFIYIHSLFTATESIIKNPVHLHNFNAFIDTYKYKKNFKILYKDMWNIELISTQYKKIKNKTLRKLIKKYFDDSYEDILNKYDYDYILKKHKHLSLKKNTTNDLLKYLKDKKIQSFLSKITSLYMDLYLILRLFKTFDSNDSFKKIIIYAGDFHISTYMKFLKILDFKMIEQSKSIKLRCQDISKMNDFFK